MSKGKELQKFIKDRKGNIDNSFVIFVTAEGYYVNGSNKSGNKANLETLVRQLHEVYGLPKKQVELKPGAGNCFLITEDECKDLLELQNKSPEKVQKKVQERLKDNATRLQGKAERLEDVINRRDKGDTDPDNQQFSVLVHENDFYIVDNNPSDKRRNLIELARKLTKLGVEGGKYTTKTVQRGQGPTDRNSIKICLVEYQIVSDQFSKEYPVIGKVSGSVRQALQIGGKKGGDAGEISGKLAAVGASTALTATTGVSAGHGISLVGKHGGRALGAGVGALIAGSYAKWKKDNPDATGKTISKKIAFLEALVEEVVPAEITPSVNSPKEINVSVDGNNFYVSGSRGRLIKLSNELKEEFDIGGTDHPTKTVRRNNNGGYSLMITQHEFETLKSAYKDSKKVSSAKAQEKGEKIGSFVGNVANAAIDAGTGVDIDLSGAGKIAGGFAAKHASKSLNKNNSNNSSLSNSNNTSNSNRTWSTNTSPSNSTSHAARFGGNMSNSPQTSHVTNLVDIPKLTNFIESINKANNNFVAELLPNGNVHIVGTKPSGNFKDLVALARSLESVAGIQKDVSTKGRLNGQTFIELTSLEVSKLCNSAVKQQQQRQ